MQQWQVDFTKKCSELNVEVVNTLAGMVVLCPKSLERKDKTQLVALIPEDLRGRVKFEEGPKYSTMNHLSNLIQALRMGGGGDPDYSRRYIKLNLVGVAEMSENVDWSNISDLLEKDGYFESWDIVLNNKLVSSYNRKIFQELQRNSFRDDVIMKDEITDLHILLETETDFDKLVARL